MNPRRRRAADGAAAALAVAALCAAGPAAAQMELLSDDRRLELTERDGTHHVEVPAPPFGVFDAEIEYVEMPLGQRVSQSVTQTSGVSSGGFIASGAAVEDNLRVDPDALSEFSIDFRIAEVSGFSLSYDRQGNSSVTLEHLDGAGLLALGMEMPDGVFNPTFHSDTVGLLELGTYRLRAVAGPSTLGGMGQGSFGLVFTVPEPRLGLLLGLCFAAAVVARARPRR